MGITADAVAAYDDFNTSGLPVTGYKEPDKAAIRALFGEIDAAIGFIGAGAMLAAGNIFTTLAALNAAISTSPAAPAMAIVWQDTAANNGVYFKVDGLHTGSWVLSPFTLPGALTAALNNLLINAEASATAAAASATQAATNTFQTAINAIVAGNWASAASVSAAAAATAEAGAQVAQANAVSIASASGISGFYDTYAAASAALGSIAANAVIQVFVDETQGGSTTIYRKVSGVLVLKISTSQINSVPFPGPNLCALGDSITVESSGYAGALGPLANADFGYLSHLNALLGHRFNFPKSNIFATDGFTLAQIASTHVANCIAAKPDVVIIHGGHNDLFFARTAAQMLSDLITGILAPLQAAGIRNIIVVPVLPFTGATGIQEGTRLSFNRAVLELGMGSATIMGALKWPPLVIDGVDDFWEARANALGGPTTSLAISDGTHPNNCGAYYMALAVFNVVDRIIPKRCSLQSNVLDIYSASNGNLRGSLLNIGTGATSNFGLMKGTGGSLTTFVGGITPTGTLADHWAVWRSTNGGTTASIVAAKENPRTDGPLTGERQKITYTCTSSGTGADVITLSPNQDLGVGFLTAGDKVYLEAKVEILSGHIGMIGVQSNLWEIGPGSPQSAQDMALTLSGNGAPFPISLFGGPDIVYVHRTQPITLQAGITALRCSFDLGMMGVNGNVCTFVVSDVSIRKVL
jgi:lysophospholipase L1-like esterase